MYSELFVLFASVFSFVVGIATCLNPGGDGAWGNPDDATTSIRIYNYDTSNGATNLVFDTGISPKNPYYGNAVALNNDTNTLYFVDSSNNLRFLNLADPTSLGNVKYNAANANTVSIGAQPATGYREPALQFDNATFFADSYWYVVSETSVLKRAVIDAATQTITRIDTFNLVDTAGKPIANADKVSLFGDIAIDSEGNLFGWTVPWNGVATFFKVDLTPNSTSTIASDGSNLLFNVIKKTDNFSMQLAFAGTTLYGHRTGKAEWYTVDTTSGALTAAVASNGAYTGGFRDIAALFHAL